jgi:hypothetical protein
MGNIVSFQEKRAEIRGCEHRNVLIDEKLWMIECSECHEKLDPIQYLLNLARDERYVQYRINELEKKERKLKDRIRTKCDHCGKMTSI